MNKNLLKMGLTVAIFCAAAGAYVGNKRLEPKTPVDGAVQKLVSLNLKDAKGVVQPLKQWQGKFLVVNFWATWCKPCVQEMPELAELQTQLAGKNVQLLGIGIDTPNNISEFAEKYKITYPVFAAGMEGTDISTAMGNQAGGLPFTVLVNSEGKIVKSYFGRLKMEELRADIQKYNI
ncbi:TlpA disulfide reductase family protein [Undibacterium cyanobacteriorum]|uniref:TlpA disulfide reductase family protein n=1 Tax=Undibacterium cyanobacteriorum TaxID=3073561 RepID=A0ABY9RGU7_9BURK|nr:TlpA disulfide reductase family protein [Undibacterium sp. 20NA77.5]WMW79467.1 TlpA disulfide reductase family protein [Undibacterium sp. 20NA77.5]